MPFDSARNDFHSILPQLVEKQMKKEQKNAETLNKKREAAASKTESLRTSLEELHFDQNQFSTLDQEKDILTSDVDELSGLIETLTTQLGSRLAFNYSDPVRGFDRSKVKGIVAKLIHVQIPDHSTALEVVAGGKLFQVVVDEAITGKAILDRGKLTRRVTIIPLDKIQPRRVTSAACDKAKEIATSMNANAWPAIELVGFDEEVRAAMEYVFGATIVVDNGKAANVICDATKTRTVTLDGDVYDPSGTISGGSKSNLGSTLAELCKLSEASKELASKKERLSIVQNELNAMKDKSKEFDEISRKLSLAEAELEGIQKHLSQTTFGVLEEKFESMSKELEESNKEYQSMQKEQEEKWELYHQLKDREVELTQHREDRLGQIEVKVKEAKTAAAEAAKKARDAESIKQTLILEVESLKADVVATEEGVVTAQNALNAAMEEETNKEITVGEVKALWDEAKTNLQNFEEKLSEFSSELSEIKLKKSSLAKKSEKCTLEAKKLSVQISRLRKEKQGAEKLVISLLKNHPWIESEKSAFGVEGGDYDFNDTDPGEMSCHLQSLKEEQESLVSSDCMARNNFFHLCRFSYLHIFFLQSKSINKKVMGMIEKAEGEYTELLRKRKVVENDKKKIQSVIEELDVKKKSELERTWKKVNRDFGSIFSTLLPGALAKLEPPEGMASWEGLEVKVAFGDVWKESLSELSGGQRSLLALSLILSLLLFKPAPMYILDEVDAALDLSHTQNIGNMLKTHFSQSQFIVVSLKEGMFNNANVIYRTKFVDGVSTVTRTIGTGSSRNRALTDANEESGGSSQISRKRQARGTSNRKDKENVSKLA
jgi:structural maintenance of chromosome 2